MANVLQWECWCLPPVFWFTEMRRQELLAAAERECAVARSLATGTGRPGLRASARWRLGGVLVAAGERLRGARVSRTDPPGASAGGQPRPAPAAAPQPDRRVSDAAGFGHRCPTCRHAVWPERPDVARAGAVAAAEDVIRRHQRRPAP